MSFFSWCPFFSHRTKNPKEWIGDEFNEAFEEDDEDDEEGLEEVTVFYDEERIFELLHKEKVDVVVGGDGVPVYVSDLVSELLPDLDVVMVVQG